MTDPRSNLMAIILAEPKTEAEQIVCRMFRVEAERKAESQQSLIDRRNQKD